MIPVSFSSTRECPYCGGLDVRSSRPRRGEWIVRVLYMAAYRCMDCDARFFGRASAKKVRPSTKQPEVETQPPLS